MQTKQTLVVLSLSIFFISLIPLAGADSDDVINVSLSYFGPYEDINHDGVINYLDASNLVSHYGQSGPPGWIRADINKDGSVNVPDASSVVSNYLEAWLVP